MTYRMFEGKDHASIYHKYRFTPPDELKNIVLQYLDKKKGRPHVLAVDLGCGTGQNSRLLAPHFREVVGIDVSECQLEEAKAVRGNPNITYRIESIRVKSLIPVKNVVGFIESWSMFQAYRKTDPQIAYDLLLNTQRRFLEEMGVTSPDTEIEWELEYFCVLASKPQ